MFWHVGSRYGRLRYGGAGQGKGFTAPEWATKNTAGPVTLRHGLSWCVKDGPGRLWHVWVRLRQGKDLPLPSSDHKHGWMRLGELRWVRLGRARCVVGG